jgi:apolipoprotein N-acyltransferase
LPPNTTLITGAARAGEALPGESRPPIFNSVQVVNEGVIVSSYDKVHLVPFGEYLPPVLERLIRSVGLSEFVSIPGGFAAGTRHIPLSIRGLPAVAPLLCYEAIFPGEVMPQQGPRPGLMLNLTNDGWFGQTSGPYQHLAQARMRAIEEGLPLVRVANTGISAVIDGYGRITASLPLGTQGVLDANLPRAAPVTLYAQFGDAALVGLIALFLLLARVRPG